MSILNEILEEKKREVLLLQENREDLVSRATKAGPPRGFVKKFLENPKPRVIAEVKQASPSRGVFISDFNYLEIAKRYLSDGAAAISVLTDEKFFQGSISYLAEISSKIDLPVLQKDFFIDEIQLYQARAKSADAVLLIVAALEATRLKSLAQKCVELELDILLEVHNREEMRVALDLLSRQTKEGACSKNTLLGINNRNLTTFETSLETTVDLIKEFGSEIKDLEISVISESGIFKRKDLEALHSCGVSGFLIGEALIKDQALLPELLRD